MIELLTGFPDNVVAVRCIGRVTKSDYDAMLVPAVEKALKAHEKVRLYYEAGPEFSGIDPAAAWEDFKVGIEHLARWQRVAVVTHLDWMRITVRIFSFIMPGDVRVFPVTEIEQARDWIMRG